MEVLWDTKGIESLETKESELDKDKKITEYKLAKEILTLGGDILLDPKLLRTKEFMQHGTTSVFEHCVSVAKFSLLMAHFLERTLRIKVDRKSLVRGALLHDYFLYDWHEPVLAHKIHGFTHPGIAWRNASRDFDMNMVEKDIIRKHMFPLTLVPPTHIESFIVCLADKRCALCETFKVDISSYIIERVNHYIAVSESLDLQMGLASVDKILAMETI